MENILLTPPVVFLIFIALFLLFSKSLSRYSNINIKGKHGLDAYACGQRNIQNYINPDYSEFFPLAFFFTLMHVITLVIATAPYDALLLPIIYILSGILVMIIIFRR